MFSSLGPAPVPPHSRRYGAAFVRTARITSRIAISPPFARWRALTPKMPPANSYAICGNHIPASAWFYTGGFENHPDWVNRIARRHRLWGMDADVLRAVRDPLRVAEVLEQAGMPCPLVRPHSRDLPRDGSWLVKPLKSGGGRGIEPLTEENEGGFSSHYFQQRINGPSFSALFVGDRLSAYLVGVTRQLIGIEGLPFL